MNARLILKYDFSRDDDDFGWLKMTIETPNFGGRGGFWVQWQDVEEWSASLLAYPLEAASERCWGYGKANGDFDDVIKISIAPINAVGDLEVCASVADQHERRNRCDVVFRTTYSELESFATGLKGVMNRASEEAVLNGRISG